MIGQVDLDGLRVLTAPAPSGGRPMAGIGFRVGVADEPARLRGISHLVEHLALAPLGDSAIHFNGATGREITWFYSKGSVPELAEFLDGVCRRLADLPMADLEREKAILRTEAAGRDTSSGDLLGLYRYGARSFGRSSLKEVGLDGITPDDLRYWCWRYFSRQNAVLFAPEDVVTGLRPQLPVGERQQQPTETSALSRTPAYFTAGRGNVAWSAVGPRSYAGVVASQVLRRDLFRSLRTLAGVSYQVNTEYDVRSGGVAELFAFADALPDQQAAALGGFLECLFRLKHGVVREADVEIGRNETIEQLRQPDAEVDMLTAEARDLLLGWSRSPLAELLVDIEAVTVDDVRGWGRQAFGSGLLMAPSGSRAENGGFVRAPESSARAVQGRTFTSPDDEQLDVVVGHDGVSLLAAAGPVTVLYAECEALIQYPDGGRRLVGADGITVRLEPGLFPALHEAIAAVDHAVPPDTRAPMRPRSADDIPQLDHAALQARAAAQVVDRRSHGRKVGEGLIVFLAVPFGLLVLWGILADYGVLSDSSFGIFVLVIIAHLVVTPIVLRRQRRAAAAGR